MECDLVSRRCRGCRQKPKVPAACNALFGFTWWPAFDRTSLGGLLADLAAEHYSWVATGDLANPDAATVMERKDRFCHRLQVLFPQGRIFNLPDTYTGTTLEFSEAGTLLPPWHACDSVQHW